MCDVPEERGLADTSFATHLERKAGIEGGESGGQFGPAIVRRWTKVLHACIALILLSGLYNTIVQFPRHRGQPLYHSLWGIKVILALVLFFIAIAVLGKSAAFERMRQKRPLWMSVNIGLAAVIVLISNILKNMPPSQ